MLQLRNRHYSNGFSGRISVSPYYLSARLATCVPQITQNNLVACITHWNKCTIRLRFPTIYPPPCIQLLLFSCQIKYRVYKKCVVAATDLTFGSGPVTSRFGPLLASTFWRLYFRATSYKHITGAFALSSRVLQFFSNAIITLVLSRCQTLGELFLLKHFPCALQPTHRVCYSHTII